MHKYPHTLKQAHTKHTNKLTQTHKQYKHIRSDTLIQIHTYIHKHKHRHTHLQSYTQTL